MAKLSVVEILRDEFQGEYREELKSVLGDRDDRAIEAWIAATLQARLGAKLQGASFASKSVGAVFGLSLAGGERVVLKVFHPLQSTSELRAMERCHAAVVEGGFPAPRALGPIFEDGALRVALYEYLDGEQLDAHEPAVRRELARSLAELHAMLHGLDPSGLPLAPTRGERLFPPSHRPFAKEHEASAVDGWAQRARDVVREAALPPMVSHIDWGTKNARFRRGKVCAVYDWDSLYGASEAESVGRAAAQFTVHWDFPARLTPTLDESRAFFDEYQSARGRSFNDAERRVAWASALYLAAQLARYGVGTARADDNYQRVLDEFGTAECF